MSAIPANIGVLQPTTAVPGPSGGITIGQPDGRIVTRGPLGGFNDSRP
jgi:hypothetical protein